MASILRVNTLTDASSNNSTPMATVAEGTAKTWLRMNGGGTPAINDSFNITSITDQATGNYRVTIATDMADAKAGGCALTREACTPQFRPLWSTCFRPRSGSYRNRPSQMQSQV